MTLFYSQNNELEQVRCSRYNDYFNSAKQQFNEAAPDASVVDSLILKSLSINNKPLSVDLFFALKVYAAFCMEDRFLFISSKLLSNGIKMNTILNEVPNCMSKRFISYKLKEIPVEKSNNKVALVLYDIFKKDKKAQSLLIGNKQRNRINNSNYNKLISLIQEINKLPGIVDSGVDYNIHHTNISLDFTQALLHFSIAQVETLLPYLINALNHNELSPYHFARIYDYYWIKKSTVESHGLKSVQFFGTYKTRDGKLFPVENALDLEARRKRFCLNPKIINLK